MLRDRLNLVGRRDGGPAGLRIDARGDALLRAMALEARLKGLGLDANNEPLDPGRRSWGGEGAKHSSNVMVEELEKLPQPNLNGGSELLVSCCLKDTLLVV